MHKKWTLHVELTKKKPSHCKSRDCLRKRRLKIRIGRVHYQLINHCPILIGRLVWRTTRQCDHNAVPDERFSFHMLQLFSTIDSVHIKQSIGYKQHCR